MNEFTEGSALRAVKVSSENEARGKRGFNYFFFLELSPVKLEALKKRIGDRFPDQLDRCRFIVGDVSESLPKLLEDISWTAMRGVAFIDPFATQLNWSSIEAFRKTHCDVWMLFPLGVIIRMLPRQHLPLPEWEQPLTRVLGDEGWKTLYTTSEARQLSLFGDESAYHTRQGTQEVINYISERLRTVFAGVWGPAELRTSNNAPLFALYSMIPEGSKIAIDHSRKIASHLIRGLG